MGEVVQGPWSKEKKSERIFPEMTYEEEQEHITETFISGMTEALFEGFREAGFDNCSDMVYTKDLAMMAESMRSYIYKLQERYHPVQDIADQFFEWNDNLDGLKTNTSSSIYVDFLKV